MPDLLRHIAIEKWIDITVPLPVSLAGNPKYCRHSACLTARLQTSLGSRQNMLATRQTRGRHGKGRPRVRIIG